MKKKMKKIFKIYLFGKNKLGNYNFSFYII